MQVDDERPRLPPCVGGAEEEDTPATHHTPESSATVAGGHTGCSKRRASQGPTMGPPTTCRVSCWRAASLALLLLLLCQQARTAAALFDTFCETNATRCRPADVFNSSVTSRYVLKLWHRNTTRAEDCPYVAHCPQVYDGLGCQVGEEGVQPIGTWPACALHSWAGPVPRAHEGVVRGLSLACAAPRCVRASISL